MFCSTCSAQILCIGLDRSRCPTCGWIASAQLLPTPKPSTTEPKTSLDWVEEFPAKPPVQSKKRPIASASIEQLSLLDGDG